MGRFKGMTITKPRTDHVCEAVRKRKPKFDKQRCLDCIYHGTGGGYMARKNGKTLGINCNFSGATKSTCLTLSEDGLTVIDRRGEDFFNCQLFVEGKPLKEKEDFEEDEIMKGESYD